MKSVPLHQGLPHGSEGYQNKSNLNLQLQAMNIKLPLLLDNLCNLDSNLWGILPKWKEMTDS